MNSDGTRPSRAEQRFRDAFERLKRNEPLLLSKGTEISQNNVAKEAGVDPSALRSSRFPELASEIQEWIKNSGSADKKKSAASKLEAKNRRISTLQDRVTELTRQRDVALSKLSSANSQILDLTEEIHRLRLELSTPNVRNIKEAKRK